jgi:hypothetical protein
VPRGGEAARGQGRGQALSHAAIVGAVEEAKRELLSAVPSPRGIQRRPIVDALVAFEERLRDADDLISASNVAPALRGRFARAIEEALRRADRLRLDAPELDYESLVSVLADLIEPLDVLGEAEGGTRDQSTSRR